MPIGIGLPLPDQVTAERLAENHAGPDDWPQAVAEHVTGGECVRPEGPSDIPPCGANRRSCAGATAPCY